MDLHQCVPLLNLIDTELEKIIDIGKVALFLQSDVQCSHIAKSSIEQDLLSNSEIEDAKELLSFSVHLLRNSINKDVYQSTEVNAYQSLCFHFLPSVFIRWP